MAMRISVVIATFNRAPLLAECLRHLSRQRFLPDDEVIVVDNGSNDDTPAVVAEAQRAFAVPVRYLADPTPGKSHAIATGLATASGDVLAFTDDDVDVAPDWIDQVRCVMSDAGIALAGGPVAPRWEAAPPQWLRAATDAYGRLAAPLGLLNYGSESFPLGPRTALGGNLVVRTEVVRKLGGYARHLGKLRGTLLSGEDHEFCMRVQAAGFRAVYWPELCVNHWVPAARMRARYAMSWFYWSGITHATLDAGEPRTRSIFQIPLHFIRRLATSSIRTAAAALRGQPARMMDNAIDVAFVAGYIARRWGAA
ncbi:MAG TPA: glycosyltransferase family 2 protein [Vicinamibacterales bacterium]|nr:glycosyltransferase family 2 protein [Vicinamibacterales bacterium]